jgi:hypothetical protein
MNLPYEAITTYALNTPFYKVTDHRYPGGGGLSEAKTYPSLADAEIAAMRLNARYLEDQADLREIRRATEIGRMHDDLANA